MFNITNSSFNFNFNFNFDFKYRLIYSPSTKNTEIILKETTKVKNETTVEKLLELQEKIKLQLLYDAATQIMQWTNHIGLYIGGTPINDNEDQEIEIDNEYEYDTLSVLNIINI